MKVNLHTHSTASDGTLSPKDLIIKLAEEKVDICALTDHDTLNGIEEAQMAANEHNIRLITGIEISTKISGLDIPFLDETKHTLHILALNFNLDKLKMLFRQRDEEKSKRLSNLVEVLNKAGYDIELSLPIKKKTDIAKKLVEQYYAQNINHAFNEIINHYYPIDMDHLTVADVVKIVHQANGKVIWAHPFDILDASTKLVLNESEVDYIMNKLNNQHIDGIEVYYEAYSEEKITFLESMADKYQYIKSCGTDFHGKPNRSKPFIEIDEVKIKEVIS